MHAALPTRALLLLLAAGGCVTVIDATLPMVPPRGAVAIDPVETADCLRTTAGRHGLGYTTLDEPVDDPELLAALESVPPDVRRVARAAGLERSLITLMRAQATAPAERTADLVTLRLDVVARISALEIELDSLLFEADCTGDQMEAALLDLDRRTRKQQITLTIASTAVGALAGIGAGVWDLRGGESNGPVVLGIGGGVASAALGFAALAPLVRSRGRVVFAHPRNLFTPIVDGDDPDRLYPPFVFRLLTTPRAPGGTTPREQLLADWRHIIDDAIPVADRTLAEAVLYGGGGIYDGALVDVRERMYDAIESQLNAIDRDFEVLYRFVGRLFGDPLAPPP